MKLKRHLEENDLLKEEAARKPYFIRFRSQMPASRKIINVVIRDV